MRSGESTVSLKILYPRPKMLKVTEGTNHITAGENWNFITYNSTAREGNLPHFAKL